MLTFVSASIHDSKAPVKQTPRSTDGAPKKYAQSMTCGAFKVYPNPKAPNGVEFNRMYGFSLKIAGCFFSIPVMFGSVAIRENASDKLFDSCFASLES